MSYDEMDALVASLEDAGLIEQFVDEGGKPALRLTRLGAQIARSMALSGSRSALDAILDRFEPQADDPG